MLFGGCCLVFLHLKKKNALNKEKRERETESGCLFFACNQSDLIEISLFIN
jgi:hypothetical protein